MHISVYTNRHGHRNYGLVLTQKEHAVELLLDPFTEFPNASAEARKSRIRWVAPVSADHDGPGTRIVEYDGQRIPWQTPEIKELLAAGPKAIAARRTELYAKYCASSYE